MGIAVQLGQHESRELQGLVESAGDVHGLLAEGAVGHKQHLVGLDLGAEAFHLLDQFLVDLEAAGGVEDDAVLSRRLGGGEGGRADGGDVARGPVGVEAQFLLLREDLELVDSRGAVDVAGRHERAVTTLLQQPAELGRRGGLPGAMEADHQDLQGPGGGELGRALAEELYQFVVDDLDDLLARSDGLDDRLSSALCLDALDELPGDLEMNVGSEEGGAHLLEGVGHVLLGQPADPAQVAER
jgi:hypothetical protein